MSNELVNPAELLKQQIANMASRVQASGDFPMIRVTQAKEFVLPDGTKTHGPVDVVIYDFICVNQLYGHLDDEGNFVEHPFKRGEENLPTCWAQHYEPAKLAPDPKLVDKPINTDCATCPMQEWGSGKNEGRACQNRRKIAVRLASDPKGPIAVLMLSKTAVTAFDHLVSDMASNNVPLCRVTMTMGFNPNSDYPQVMFQPSAENPDFEADANRLIKARELIERLPVRKEDAGKAA